MKKLILTMVTSVVITLAVFAQAAGDYQSIASGKWNDPANWETFDGNNWVSATSYPGKDPGTGAVNISAFSAIKITANVPYQVASLWIHSYFDEWTYESYYGILTFSAESTISLAVSGNIDGYGELNVEDRLGAKSHMLAIGGSFYGLLNAINEDDNLNVIFNSTVSNTTISGGTFQDVTFNGSLFSVYGMTINGRVTL